MHVPTEKHDKRQHFIKNVNACDNFFELMVTGHIIACATELLGMSKVNKVPSKVIDSPQEAWSKYDSNESPF